MPEPLKPRRPRPTFHLVRKDGDRIVDFETFTGETLARRALDDARINAGWRYVQLEPGQSYNEALAARA
jgi:hypothetical protein